MFFGESSKLLIVSMLLTKFYIELTFYLLLTLYL